MSNTIITLVFDAMPDKLPNIATLFTPDNKKYFNLYFERMTNNMYEIRVMVDYDPELVPFPVIVGMLKQYDLATRVRNYTNQWFSSYDGVLDRYYIELAYGKLKAQREFHKRAWFPEEVTAEHVDQAVEELNSWEIDQYHKWLAGEHTDADGQYLNDIIGKWEVADHAMQKAIRKVENK